MDNSISKIFEGEALPKELLATLQEAFDKRVAEAHKQAEMTVREEMAARYEHDKANLVEAMNRMLNDVVTQHATEQAEAIQKFTEAKNKFRKAIKESRKNYNNKLNEDITRSRKVVVGKLREEITKLREQKRKLVAETMNSGKKVNVMKEAMAKMYAKRVRKIDEFVVNQITNELKAFREDHNALVKTRVKLVAEGRKKLRETQNSFIKTASQNVEKIVTEALKKEMATLHEDLERNRQNMFGRRIFETFAAEYLTSYLAEETEIRKLQIALESAKKEANSAQTKLTEAVKEKQVSERKARLAEDRATRNKVLNELLNPLRGEKRHVMEGLLETVKTEALRESFNKLLPVVLDEKKRTENTGSRDGFAKKPLLEQRSNNVRNSNVVTGDNQSATRLFERNQAETTEFNNDMADVIRLAGIQK